jgi:hypothetical protein
MTQPTRGRVLTDIQREIEAELNMRPMVASVSDYLAPPTVVAPALAIPDYVVHREGATEIGKLSAEAVVREFEAAAKEMEAMGAQLIERVKQCEAMTLDAFAVTNELNSVAARYREEAKRIFAEIEDCSKMTAEVRKTCADLLDRISVPLVTEKLKQKRK